MATNKIYVVESHEQVLDLWREEHSAARRVTHLDFHCDLRGLLIHRKKQRAYRIWDRFPDVDEGNFLTHAILEGHVGAIRWVHDEPGGRQYDLKTVKYETDLSALVSRGLLYLRRERGMAIEYEVVPKSRWAGLEAGDVLDNSWDYFACREYAIDSVSTRVADFLGRDLTPVPTHTYVCYSPNYSHPTREPFEQFVEQLAGRFDANVVDVRPRHRASANGHGSERSALYQSAKRVYHRLGFALRKRGVY